MSMNRRKITIFTDGSATTKGEKLGGCGVYLLHQDGEEEFLSKGYRNTKTGRMEIRAFLFALQKLRKDIPLDVTVYSDSNYVVKTMNEGWVYNWEDEGWFMRTNADLWKMVLTEYRTQHPQTIITINHIKGHQKDLTDDLAYGNAVADALADYKIHKHYLIDLE